MPTQYDMSENTVLYRGVLEYDAQPTKVVPNPEYGKPVRPGTYVPAQIRVPDGPAITKQIVIGPYADPKQIKSYITRKRDSYYANLRLVRAEQVEPQDWKEVEI